MTEQTTGAANSNDNSTTTIMDEGEAILDSGSLFDVEGLMMETTPSTTTTATITPSSSSTTTTNLNHQQQMNQQTQQQQPTIVVESSTSPTTATTTSSNEEIPANTISPPIPSSSSSRRRRASSAASSSTPPRRNSTASTSSVKPKKKKGGGDVAEEEESHSEEGSSSVEDTLSHLKLLPNQRASCPMEEVPSNQQGRYWIFETAQQGELSEVTVRVTMKIRGEEAKNYVPEKLYSSHKYVIMHEISGKSLVEKYPLIVSKIHVINPSNREELKNSKNTNKLCLMGTMETALTKTTTGATGGKKAKDTPIEEVVKGQMKVQFTDVSYHHEKGHFGFIIHYFNPGNLDRPLFSLIAPPFNVFARKPTNENQTETLQPTKPKSSKKKRKSTDPIGDEDSTMIHDSSTVDSLSSSTAVQSSSTTAASVASVATNPSQPATSTTTTLVEEPVKKKTRRQTKKRATNSEEAHQDLVNIPEVVMNVSHPSQNMQLFNSKLESILAIKKQLGQDANKKASELALQNLLVLDPHAAHNFLLHSSDCGSSSGGSNTQ